jgi:hypothetical protein
MDGSGTSGAGGLMIFIVRPSRNVWLNLTVAITFALVCASANAAWNYFEGKPPHYFRLLAIYSMGGAVVFGFRQFFQQTDQQQK